VRIEVIENANEFKMVKDNEISGEIGIGVLNDRPLTTNLREDKCLD